MGNEKCKITKFFDLYKFKCPRYDKNGGKGLKD
jgi:hypothetical protein